MADTLRQDAVDTISDLIGRFEAYGRGKDIADAREFLEQALCSLTGKVYNSGEVDFDSLEI